MRNWNLLLQGHLFQSWKVLSLPMRNWNSLLKDMEHLKKTSFEPTYEELKLPIKNEVYRISFSFEPTYEELKPSIFQCNSMVQISFEPTYEELKQCKLSHPNINISTFWAYLWGIETPYHLFFMNHYIIVLSLPMRNWNYAQITLNWRSRFCFEPTYEELKLFMKKYCGGEKCFVLSLPMRNWNQILQYLHERFAGFWAYLWGIETVAPLVSRLFQEKVLSLPMRNWNSELYYYHRHLSLAFWAYLWGIETRVSWRVKGDYYSSFEPTYEELKLRGM